jgi:hypothetical protein
MNLPKLEVTHQGFMRKIRGWLFTKIREWELKEELRVIGLKQ